MLLLEITLGRSSDAAGFRLFCVMVFGSPVRAVTIGSNSKSRTQREPLVRYWMAEVKLLVRSNVLSERSRLRDNEGNWPLLKTSGWEKLSRPSPSSIDFDQV